MGKKKYNINTEWQIAYSRIPAATTYTIEFPSIATIHEIYFQSETTTTSTIPFNIIFNSGSGNLVDWVDSSYATYNYNMIRILAHNANLQRIKINMNVYGIVVDVGATSPVISMNFMFNLIGTRKLKYNYLTNTRVK